MLDRTLRLLIGPVIAFLSCTAANATDYQQILNELNEDSDKILTVKEFNPDWVSTFDQHGEPITYTRANSAGFDYIGMPIGGICSGQLYLGGDGKLWCWDIFNTKTMRDVRGVPTHANPYKRSEQALEEQCDFGSMTLALIECGSAVKATTSFNPPDGPFVNTTEPTTSFSDKSPIGALGRVFRLKPGEHITARFILSWYFPVLPDVPVRTPGGLHYGTRFQSAADVAEHIRDNFEQLSSQTRLRHETWYNSTLPWWFLDRTFANTSILATNTCYLFSDGRFFGWEGVYHGNGTCTHVWGYVQAPGRLFPEIERRLREMVDYKPGIGFVPETGLIAYRAGYRRFGGWAVRRHPEDVPCASNAER